MHVRIILTSKGGTVFEGETNLVAVKSSEKKSEGRGRKQRPANSEQYSGPSGGVKMLLSRGYFSSLHVLSEIREALSKEGYHYSAAAVQTALNRLAGRGGPLATGRRDGRKAYVRRK